MDKYCNKIKSRDEFFCIDLSKGTGLVDVFLSLNRIECLPQKIWIEYLCFRLKSLNLKPHFNQIIMRDCFADTDLIRFDSFRIKLL